MPWMMSAKSLNQCNTRQCNIKLYLWHCFLLIRSFSWYFFFFIVSSRIWTTNLTLLAVCIHYISSQPYKVLDQCIEIVSLKRGVSTFHKQGLNSVLVMNFNFFRTSSDRAASAKRAFDSCSKIVKTSEKYMNSLENRPKWQPPQTRGAIEPSEMTITHVNQTADLFVCYLHL